MRGIERRLLKLETRQGEHFSAWLKRASDDELKARLRGLLGKAFNCEPEKVDMSPEALEAVGAQIRAALNGS